MSEQDKTPISIDAKRWFQAVLIGVAFLAYFLQPLLRFANPVDLFEAAFLMAAGFTLYPSFAKSEGASKIDALLIAWAVIVVTWGIYDLYGEIRSAKAASRLNDRRCLVIEREMMRGSPRRDDLPDIFQAMGCRPQTTLMPKRPAALD